jgi:DNA replication and repair protein RecF
VLLARLGLSNFRNFSELILEPAPGLNVFVGANAQGKSNLLEGIAMLGTGKSFRTTRDADTVREGFDRAVVQGRASLHGSRIELVCTVARSGRGTRKGYTVNGHSVRYAGYLGKMPVVTFVPTDLQLASGAPIARRAFLNVALSQTEARYYYELARYRNAIQQKNALLRDPAAPDVELLAVYDRTLTEAGAHIMSARAEFVRALAEPARRAHGHFAAGERLELRYEPNVVFDICSRDTIAAALAARLRQVAESERARKSAIVGPHRDDVSMTLNGTSLGTFGSQGQQRTAVLALKVAEYTVMRERSNEAPLLLLDDVLSELDEERAAAFLTGIGDYEQAFVTATRLPTGLLPGARLFEVRHAGLRLATAC